jgi:hypothetical protein
MTVLGFDGVDVQDEAWLKARYAEDFRVASLYIGGPRASVNQTADRDDGSNYLRLCERNGYTIVPIYVGLQESDIAGMTDSTILARAMGDAHYALANLHRAEVVAGHRFRYVVLDREDGMTAKGSTYSSGWAAEVRRSSTVIPLLYRPSSGASVSGVTEWLADPNYGSLDSIPADYDLGIYLGIQLAWLDGYDVTLWHQDVLAKAALAPSPKPTRKSPLFAAPPAPVVIPSYDLPVYANTIDVVPPDAPVSPTTSEAPLKTTTTTTTHPPVATGGKGSNRLSRAATVTAGTAATAYLATSGHPTPATNIVAGVVGILWYVLQEALPIITSRLGLDKTDAALVTTVVETVESDAAAL